MFYRFDIRNWKFESEHIIIQHNIDYVDSQTSGYSDKLKYKNDSLNIYME